MALTWGEAVAGGCHTSWWSSFLPTAPVWCAAGTSQASWGFQKFRVTPWSLGGRLCQLLQGDELPFTCPRGLQLVMRSEESRAPAASFCVCVCGRLDLS